MGVIASTEESWNGSTMPSQKDKLAIVTGANSGIGFEAAKALAAHGAHVILACRHEVDVGDPDSVREFARAFHDKFDHLDLLINNAGVSVPAQRHMPNGLEAHFAINHLGHFYLTSLLLDLLRRSKDQARVVNVSSLAHYFAWMYLNFSTLGHTRQSPRLPDVQDGQPALHLRAAASTFPYWLAELFVWLVSWLPFMTSKVGALPILYAATMTSVKGGEYYGPNGFLHMRGYPALEAGAKSSHSLENASKLWKLSEDTLDEEY
ncbi:WW domain-containing oxidoreductase [Phytophthora cinnamomi]|uniref:WW domain-containing oxidoreductase n=1 Tax=Phytophthora cinnamomi TaxID=4785 RepID=UPI00355990FC|nr:WW domain-containing oxidoreductase [Phytophthora cinnamomi]